MANCKIRWGILLALLALTGVPSLDFGGQERGNQSRVTLKLSDSDLLPALTILSQKSGLKIVLDSSGRSFGRVTVDLRDLPAEDVLRYICQAAGAYFRVDENGVYVVSDKKPTSAESTPEKKVVGRFRFANADGSLVYARLMGFDTFDPTSVPAERLDIRRISDHVAKGWLGNESTPYGVELADPIRAVPVDIARPNAVQNSGSGERSRNLTPGSWPPTIPTLSYDPTDNSLIYEGTPEAVDELISILREFDVASPQIEIQVEVAAVKTSDYRLLKWPSVALRGAIRSNTSPWSFIRAGDPVFLFRFDGDSASKTRSFLERRKIKLVSLGTVKTPVDHPVPIFPGPIPLKALIARREAGKGVAIPGAVPLGVDGALVVEPREHQDNTITLQVGIQVQVLGEQVGSAPPNVVALQVVNGFRIRDGESAAFAGLAPRFYDQGSTLLKDLPLLAPAYARAAEYTEDLVIFLTARRVRASDPAGPRAANRQN